MVVSARHNAVNRSPQRRLLHPLPRRHLGLARLLQVSLHLHPAHITDAAFGMHPLHPLVGILGLTQCSHSCIVQARHRRRVDLRQQLTLPHLVPVLHRHLCQLSTKGEPKVHLHLRAYFTHILTFSRIVPVRNHHGLDHNRVAPSAIALVAAIAPRQYRNDQQQRNENTSHNAFNQ